MNQLKMQQDARTRAPLGAVRHDWTVEEVLGLFHLPFPELVYTAQSIHRRHFDPDTVQFAQLLSIKTARDSGATRFCMGAAWRSPKDRDVDQLCSTIEAVKASAWKRA